MKPSDDKAVASLARQRFLADTVCIRVGSLAPVGLARYVRVLHSAEQSDSESQHSWANVAHDYGSIVHAEAQWECVTKHLPVTDRNLMRPELGELPGRQHLLLRRLLAATGPSDIAFMGVWSGYAGLEPLSRASTPVHEGPLGMT